MNAKRRGAAPAAPIDEAELAAVTPHLFQRPALWAGLALAADARDDALRRPQAAYWALRLGTAAPAAAAAKKAPAEKAAAKKKATEGGPVRPTK